MRYRKYWLPEVVGLVGLGLVATVPFWLSSIDLTVANWFYSNSDGSNAWPLKNVAIYRFFFWLAPWLTVVLGLTGLVILGVGIVQTQRFRFRLYGLYIFLAVVVGPGLVVNALFKDNWERPRPRQVEVFGGDQPYVPPLGLGEVGNSFPCGHCSVAFALAAFYLLWRRRYPTVAIAALNVSIALGCLMGLARISAGGHFLSDILWSAALTWSTLLLLYWPVMRIPWREERLEQEMSRSESNMSITAKVASIVLISLIAFAGVVFTWKMY